jgi:flagellum-specific ATP synthase
MDALTRLADALDAFARPDARLRVSGVVTEVSPAHFRVDGLSAHLRLEDCVRLEGDGRSCLGQVIRLDRDGVLVKSFDSNAGVGLGACVTRVGAIEIAPHRSWKGRVIDALGREIDGLGPLLQGPAPRRLDAAPPKPMARAQASVPAPTGVHAIDAFTPLCRGQRIGVFAGSGVGKSTLLAMMTRSAAFDVAVICLVGERGREVRDFLCEALAESAGDAVVVVATGDESTMMRRLAPLTAMSIAESFRDDGRSVLLIMDSVTRYAHALREIALAAGEPPAANGFTPSVFADIPRLLERAGPGVEGGGDITAVFSVLVDGDNHNEPIADCIRGTLDGHIVLEREIAEQGRYPAINVLKSISRLSDRVWRAPEREAMARARALIARYEDTRDLRLLGAYQAGADPELDRAVTLAPKIYEALQQSPRSVASDDIIRDLAALISFAVVSHG